MQQNTSACIDTQTLRPKSTCFLVHTQGHAHVQVDFHCHVQKETQLSIINYNYMIICYHVNSYKMWWIYQETAVLSLCECVTNSLCLEEFAYQYINKKTKKKKKINQREEHGLTIRLWNLLNQHIIYVIISFCNLLLILLHIIVFETVISAPVMGCRNKCNFKDATKGKKSS